jgi:membrane-associated phospholipid phosphatase
VVVAGAVVFAWRHFARPVLVWALLVAPALVISAAHTPSDVVGGGLVGLMLLLLAWAVGESSRAEGLFTRSAALRS